MNYNGNQLQSSLFYWATLHHATPEKMIQILPLGAGQDVGRSCIIVTIGGRRIMFDCGMHMGFNDERRFPDFTVLSASRRFDKVIDLVIISHFHLDHCGGLPYFTEMCGYSGPILMTYPTKDICPILLEDFRKITVEKRGEQNFFTSRMIESCMAKVTAMDLSQEILIGEGIRVKAYYAGHVLGAAMFHVKVGEESVLYTGDFNMTPDRHLGGALIDRCEPDVLITESTYAATIRESKRARERDFLKQCHQCVAAGGKVLIPTFALGRVQELCVLIDAYWSRAGLDEIPVYFTGGLAETATKYYKNWIQWTSEGMLHKSRLEDEHVGPLSRNPFDFVNIRPFERSFSDLPGPMVVFSTPGMLHSGTSLELFKKWCSDPRNMLIIPGYCVAGTVGAKVLAGQKTIDLQEVRVRGTTLQTINVQLEVKLQIKNLSFSAHVDAKGILQLISQCRPKNVVLVHGEGSKMQILKDRIVNNFSCPVYYPANGEVIFIETLSSIAGCLQVSENLFKKMRRDIFAAAQEVARNPLLSDERKSELLVESCCLQDCPVDYLKEISSKHHLREALLNLEFPPKISEFWEIEDKPIGNLSDMLTMRHSVIKFFRKSRAFETITELCNEANSKESSIYLNLIQALLIGHFHPYICIGLDRKSQILTIHSMKTDQETDFPLILLKNLKEISENHISYTLEWCQAGEKLAKAVMKIFRDHLE